MSDYTPDGISESEPSMEDILASIRKIIADDSSKPTISEIEAPEPVLRETVAVETDAQDDILDLADDEFSEFLSDDLVAPSAAPDAGDDDVLDLTDSLLSDYDLTVNEPDDLSADFDLVLDDDDSDDSIALKAGAAVAAAGAAAVAATGLSGEKPSLDIIADADFDDAEFDLDVPLEPETVFDPAAELLSAESDVEIDSADTETSDLAAPIEAALATDGVDAPPAAMTEDADIDLVKSLMAELTEDDDSFDDIEDIDTAGVADAQDADAPNIETLDAGSDDDFDIDDIIGADDDAPSDMTGVAATASDEPIEAGPIDDDLASIVAQSSADIEAAKSDALALDDAAPDADDDAFDMSDILETAEADAADIQMPEQTDAEPDDASGPGILGAAIAGASVLGVSAAGMAAVKSDKETPGGDTPEANAPELDAIETAAESAHDFIDVKPEPETKPVTEIAADAADPTPTEDTDMPRIVKADTIAADETVEATSDAFASLSQVVEEKAVFNESGPRIGDLVQEALKPMLQEWLDKNLKGIVDRAVAKEIKRISSGK